MVRVLLHFFEDLQMAGGDYNSFEWAQNYVVKLSILQNQFFQFAKLTQNWPILKQMEKQFFEHFF